MASIIHQKIHISGMTCVNCQRRIKQALQNTSGIVKVSVSYKAGTADVDYDTDTISLRDITAIIEQLDYRVPPEQSNARADLGRMICTLVIIVCFYILLQRFGVLNLLAPSRLADTNMGYGLLFIIGVITSVHCIAMCGGINLSQCIPRKNGDSEQNGASAVMPSILYNLGRVISYTVIGFLLGFVGFVIGGGGRSGLPTLFQGILKLIAGALMVIMGFNMLGLFPWLHALTPRPPKFLSAKIGAQRAKATRPLAVGLLNGLMPCGPLQSMHLVALASGSSFAGALSMFLFSLGTVPLMLGLGSLVSILGKRFARTVSYVGAVLVAVLGLAMLSQGAGLSGLLQPGMLLILIVALYVLGITASVPFRRKALRLAGITAVICAAAVVIAAHSIWSGAGHGISSDASGTAWPESADGVQVVTSNLSSGQYPSITVRAGTPVEWIIDAPEGSINGCNYKMILREYDIEHTFQEGENVIEFTPMQTGIYQYSCWMGMIRGNIFVMKADSAAIQTESDQFETAVYPPEIYNTAGSISCCGG